MFTKLDTVIVRVGDLERARAWYEEKLAFRAAFTHDASRIVVFDACGETSLTIWELGAGERKASGGEEASFPILYAEGIAAAHTALRERGVEVGEIEGEARGTQWFTLRDLEGNRLDVCHY